MLGRPGCWLPVWMKRDRRVVIDRLGVDGLDDRDVVDDLAVCGSSSLSHAPLLPCCANLKIDFVTGNELCPDVMPVMRWPMPHGRRQFRAVQLRRASACSRTGRSATARRIGADR